MSDPETTSITASPTLAIYSKTFITIRNILLIVMVEDKKSTDALLTEYLPAADNARDTIDGAAKITLAQDGRGLWGDDSGEALDEDPDEYHVKCEECAETFGSWGKATKHAEEEH